MIEVSFLLLSLGIVLVGSGLWVLRRDQLRDEYETAPGSSDRKRN